MLFNACSYSVLSFGLRVLFWTSSTVVASNDCAPITWLEGAYHRKVAASAFDDVNTHLASAASTSSSAAVPSQAPIQPGEINCRLSYGTWDDVNYYTCTELAEQFGIGLDLFFVLNPGLAPDCGNIQPNTKYCVKGCKCISGKQSTESVLQVTDKYV